MAGTTGIQNPLYVYFSQSVAAIANNDYTLTRPGNVVNAWCIVRTGVAQGTFQISRVRTGPVVVAITDAMNCSATGSWTGVGTIAAAGYAVIVGDILRMATAGAAVLVDGVAVIVPPVANSTTVV